MSGLARPLLAGFGMAHFNLGFQLGDLKNEDALRRARGDAGSSISWIVGHLLTFRGMALQGCGVEYRNPWGEIFSFQSPATDGAGYPDLSELKAEWDRLHGQLAEVLSAISDEQLLADSLVPRPGDDPSLLGLLSFCQWHEAYHVGAIGLLRVQWGYRHTHELVMEAMGMG